MMQQHALHRKIEPFKMWQQIYPRIRYLQVNWTGVWPHRILSTITTVEQCGLSFILNSPGQQNLTKHNCAITVPNEGGTTNLTEVTFFRGAGLEEVAHAYGKLFVYAKKVDIAVRSEVTTIGGLTEHFGHTLYWRHMNATEFAARTDVVVADKNPHGSSIVHTKFFQTRAVGSNHVHYTHSMYFPIMDSEPDVPIDQLINGITKGGTLAAPTIGAADIKVHGEIGWIADTGLITATSEFALRLNVHFSVTDYIILFDRDEINHDTA